MIRSEANPQKVLLNETVRLPPKGEHAEKNIFSSAGTYRAVVNVDGSDAQEFTWTIEEMPVGGGFQLVIDPDGDLYDHVVGSP